MSAADNSPQKQPQESTSGSGNQAEENNVSLPTQSEESTPAVEEENSSPLNNKQNGEKSSADGTTTGERNDAKTSNGTTTSSSVSNPSDIEFAVTLDNVPRLQRALEKLQNSSNDASSAPTFEDIFEMAVKRSKVQICKYCLKQTLHILKTLQNPSIDVNKTFTSFHNSNALMQSIKTKTTTDKELYTLLLEHGADPRKGDDYFTPIQKAITNQDLDLIDTLVDAGVNLEEEDQNPAQRGTALWFALHMNCFQSFAHLIELGANVNAKRKNKSLLHYISEHREIKQSKQIIKMLLENHCDMEVKDEKGMTPFLHAVDYGRLDVLRTLKEAGANVKATDNRGKNALAICVDSAHAIYHPEAVEYVLKLDLDDSDAVRALQNMIDKIGGDLYIKMGEAFVKQGKSINLAQENKAQNKSEDEPQEVKTSAADDKEE